MKRTFALLLGLSVTGVFGHSLLVAADESPDVSAYYGWLDKYQNPEKQSVIATSQQRERSFQEATPSDTPVQHVVPSDTDSTPGESTAESTSAEVVFEQAEAGEGLGCYYHRSYYSHLPMFKEGAYHLPGSLDVAEPYQKTSSHAISSPATPTP